MVRFSNLSSPEYIMELRRQQALGPGTGGAAVGTAAAWLRHGTRVPGSRHTHRRMERLLAPMSWQPCWMPAIR